MVHVVLYALVPFVLEEAVGANAIATAPPYHTQPTTISPNPLQYHPAHCNISYIITQTITISHNSEPSQSEITLWWPTWRGKWWPKARWTRWPTRRPTWRLTKKNGRNGVGHGGRQKKMTSNLVDSWLRRLVNWAQTFMTRSLPDLRVF